MRSKIIGAGLCLIVMCAWPSAAARAQAASAGLDSPRSWPRDEAPPRSSQRVERQRERPRGLLEDEALLVPDERRDLESIREGARVRNGLFIAGGAITGAGLVVTLLTGLAALIDGIGRLGCFSGCSSSGLPYAGEIAIGGLVVAGIGAVTILTAIGFTIDVDVRRRDLERRVGDRFTLGLGPGGVTLRGGF